MKKKLLVIAMAVLALTLVSCGSNKTQTNTDTKESAVASTASNSSSDSATQKIDGEDYTFELPKDFIETTDTLGEKIWNSPDFETTGFSVKAYGTGHVTYTNDTIAKTYEEWVGDNADSFEKISYDYTDDGEYEQCTYIVKVNKSSDIAELSDYFETDLDNEQSENYDGEYMGQRVIVNKADRSQAIVIDAASRDESDIAAIQEIIDSFEWK